MIQLSESAAKVLGCLREKGGQMLPSDLRREHEEFFATPTHYAVVQAHPEVRQGASAVMHINDGIEELIAADICEFVRSAAGLKMLTVTQKGAELIG